MAVNGVNGNGEPVHAELSSWQHYNQGHYLFTVWKTTLATSPQVRMLTTSPVRVGW
jgi:hypothetical protein